MLFALLNSWPNLKQALCPTYQSDFLSKLTFHLRPSFHISSFKHHAPFLHPTLLIISPHSSIRRQSNPTVTPHFPNTIATLSYLHVRCCVSHHSEQRAQLSFKANPVCVLRIPLLFIFSITSSVIPSFYIINGSLMYHSHYIQRYL